MKQPLKNLPENIANILDRVVPSFKADNGANPADVLEPGKYVGILRNYHFENHSQFGAEVFLGIDLEGFVRPDKTIAWRYYGRKRKIFRLEEPKELTSLLKLYYGIDARLEDGSTVCCGSDVLNIVIPERAFVDVYIRKRAKDNQTFVSAVYPPFHPYKMPADLELEEQERIRKEKQKEEEAEVEAEAMESETEEAGDEYLRDVPSYEPGTTGKPPF